MRYVLTFSMSRWILIEKGGESEEPLNRDQVIHFLPNLLLFFHFIQFNTSLFLFFCGLRWERMRRGWRGREGNGVEGEEEGQIVLFPENTT